MRGVNRRMGTLSELSLAFLVKVSTFRISSRRSLSDILERGSSLNICWSIALALSEMRYKRPRIRGFFRKWQKALSLRDAFVQGGKWEVIMTVRMTPRAQISDCNGM
jgi:hypothetical protein